MYFLVRVENLEYGISYKSELWSQGKIITARIPYTLNEFLIKDIHDTHVKSTPRNLWFPKHFPQKDAIESVWSQMNKISICVGEILKPKAKSFGESKCAYEVFELDFLVTDDFNVFLLEANDRVGFDPMGSSAEGFDGKKGPWDEEFTAFSRDYFQWVYNNVIKSFT